MSFSPSEIAELFARSEVEIRGVLASAEDSDIAGVCRVRGVQVGASREESVEILIAHKVTSETTSSGAKKSAPKKSAASESVKTGGKFDKGEKDKSLDALMALNMSELKGICKDVGIEDISGLKKDIARRIFERQSLPRTDADVDIRILNAAEFQAAMNASGSSSDVMAVDEISVFAFTSFPEDTNEFEAYTFIVEKVPEFFAEFNVEILGSRSATGEIALKIPRAEVDALKKVLVDKADKFTFGGSLLTTCDVDAQFISEYTIPTPAPRGAFSKRLGGWSPEIARKRAATEEVLGAAPTAPTPLPEAPALPAGVGEKNWDEKFSVLMESVSSLVIGVNELRAAMPQVVTRDDLRAIQEKQREEFQTIVYSQVEPLKETIKTTVEPLKEDVSLLRARVSAVENANARPIDDPGFRRISFLGFSEKSDADERICAVMDFLNKHVPKVNKIVDNIYRGSFKDKTRSLTTVAYAEFPSSDTRDRVLDILTKHTLNFEGKKIDIKRGLTRSAKERNGALNDALKLITADPRARGKHAKKEFVGERGVTVDGVYAFSQGSVGKGDVVGVFADLILPDRPLPRR